MILNLVVIFITFLIGMGLGIIGSVMLDRSVGRWLWRRMIEPEPQSIQKRLLATLLRRGVFIIIMVGLIGVMVKVPILVIRQLAFGIVAGVGFSFFFLVGSYLNVKVELPSSEAGESSDSSVTP
jgi:hypothetical protein